MKRLVRHSPWHSRRAPGDLRVAASTGADDFGSPLFPSRRFRSRRGTVLFEALLAIIVLIVSVFAFIFLFTSNTGRMAKARDRRETAVVADSVLNNLRAISDEEARRTHWLQFWTDYAATNSAVLVTNRSQRLPVRYRVNVALTNNSIGLTNRAVVLLQAWQGSSSATNSTNCVRMYAEFWDTGSL